MTHRWSVNPLVLSGQIPVFSSVFFTTYRRGGDGYGGKKIQSTKRTEFP